MAPLDRSEDPVADYEVTERHGEARVRFRGELRADSLASRLNRDLERPLRDRRVRTVQLDLSGVDVIDLEGVGVLVSVWRWARERGKRLVIRGARGQVREKLRITGLLRLLETA